MGVIETYLNGIERTAEVMVVGPWFPEAVEMLRQHEGLDVGVHIVLTSEWDGYKWRNWRDYLVDFAPRLFRK